MSHFDPTARMKKYICSWDYEGQVPIQVLGLFHFAGLVAELIRISSYPYQYAVRGRYHSLSRPDDLLQLPQLVDRRPHVFRIIRRKTKALTGARVGERQALGVQWRAA